jgi:hypothetical protein
VACGPVELAGRDASAAVLEIAVSAFQRMIEAMAERTMAAAISNAAMCFHACRPARMLMAFSVDRGRAGRAFHVRDGES